jgi:vesicle-fusing ATPase
MLILATTTQRSVLTQLDIFNSFDADIPVPNVNTHEELAHILRESRAFTDADQKRAIQELRGLTGNERVGVGIKKILLAIETARQDDDMPGRLASVIARAVSESMYSS